MGKWIFDDVSSFGHILLGIVAAKSHQGFNITAMYMLYQSVEKDPSWLNKAGDFLEFGLGYAIGKEV